MSLLFEREFAGGLRVVSQTCGPLATNAYLVRQANEAVIVDPAIQSDELLEFMLRWKSEGVRLAAIWNTHGHFDHIYDNARWQTHFDVPILAHPADAFFLEHLREQALWFGLPAPEVALATTSLAEGQTLRVGQASARVLELPGHSPGSVGFDFGPFIVSGDVLFEGSYGRVDLPGASAPQLANSLRRLFTLPDDTLVLPGHGDATTIGLQKRANIAVRGFLTEFPA